MPKTRRYPTPRENTVPSSWHTVLKEDYWTNRSKDSVTIETRRFQALFAPLDDGNKTQQIRDRVSELSMAYIQEAFSISVSYAQQQGRIKPSGLKEITALKQANWNPTTATHVYGVIAAAIRSGLTSERALEIYSQQRNVEEAVTEILSSLCENWSSFSCLGDGDSYIPYPVSGGE